MYVGMTRAKENLYLSWASERTIFGKTKWNMPSRFLLEAGFGEQLSNSAAARTINRRNDFNFNKDVEVSFEDTMDMPKQTDNSPYQIGTMVSHPTFGNGKIIEKSGSGDDLKLIVLFNGGQWKKLLAKFANLKII